MSLRNLAIYLISLLIIWFLFSVWIASIANRLLDLFILIVGFFFLFGGINLIGYTLLLMYRVLPQIDAFVGFGSHKAWKEGNDFVVRYLRLADYAFSSISELYNSRANPQYDARKLPANLRLPMVVFSYWLFLCGFSVILGLVSMKFTEG